jgi:hypothetical protein
MEEGRKEEGGEDGSSEEIPPFAQVMPCRGGIDINASSPLCFDA